jgi:hypothetical protein
MVIACHVSTTLVSTHFNTTYHIIIAGGVGGERETGENHEAMTGKKNRHSIVRKRENCKI